jgi:hypothetical protein
VSLLVVVGITGSAVTVSLAAVGVFLWLAKLKKNASRRIAKDPPDPQFAEPVQLSPSTFRPAALGVDDGGPLGRAASHITESSLVTDALVTAVERSGGQGGRRC